MNAFIRSSFAPNISTCPLVLHRRCLVLVSSILHFQRGHPACLGDIAQNIAKMLFFLHSEGSLERVLQKLAQIEQISIFSINFMNCQFNCIIIIVKEQSNLLKIEILPSCTEELCTAKQ